MVAGRPKKLGPNANALARAHLLVDIRSASQIGKKRLRKLSNGQGREAGALQQQIQMAEAKKRSMPVADSSPVMAASKLLGTEAAITVAAKAIDEPYAAFELEW